MPSSGSVWTGLPSGVLCSDGSQNVSFSIPPFCLGSQRQICSHLMLTARFTPLTHPQLARLWKKRVCGGKERARQTSLHRWGVERSVNCGISSGEFVHKSSWGTVMRALDHYGLRLKMWAPPLHVLKERPGCPWGLFGGWVRSWATDLALAAWLAHRGTVRYAGLWPTLSSRGIISILYLQV